jgi:uncharacterized GH25 family protein
MRRFLSVLALGLVMGVVAQAHHVYVVPDTKKSAKVIFSDSLEPDAGVPIAKIKSTKLFYFDGSSDEGKPLILKEEKDHYTVQVPGKGSRVVYGSTEYGVLKKGDAKPFRLIYYPKAIFGLINQETQKVGEALPFEIVPVDAKDKIRFQVIVKGKPLADAEISVAVPNSDKREKLTTDKEGFTKAFDAKGTYGLWARHSENVTGEAGGMKYEEIRSYATLVVEFDGE